MILTLRIFLGTVGFALLTILTQVGGLAFLISMMTYRRINKRYETLLVRVTAKLLSFGLVYTLIVFAIVPPVAKHFGRVPLPLAHANHVQPAPAIREDISK